MSQSIDQFMSEMKADLEEFEAAYRKKAEESPEHYPLEMVSGNEGLWFEFFMTFAQTRQV